MVGLLRIAQIGALAACVVLFATQARAEVEWAPYDGAGTEVYPQEAWAKAARPEDLGWSSSGLDAARAFSERIGTTALILAKGGVVVAAWGEVAGRSNIYSGRKSLLSALIGIAVAEGRIDLGDRLDELGIDEDEPGLTPAEKQATVADLIASRSGIYLPALYESPRVSAAKPERGSHAPGSRWLYNNWDFNALGTIYERQTGAGIFEAFADRIAAPLQMQDFAAEDGEYVRGEQSRHPAYPFHMTARDLARFALLYLRRGRWDGRQVVPEDWVAVSTARHSDVGPDKGYGYMWWNGVAGGLLPNVTIAEESFYASGLGGQYAFVFPHLDLVLVHLVDKARGGRLPSSAQVGRLLWQILSAGGVAGLGPDPSIEGAPGRRLRRADLVRLLPGPTVTGGSPGRPGTAKVLADGGLAGRSGPNEEESDVGSWRLDGDRYCRTWRTWSRGRERCYDLVRDGTVLRAFDGTGTLIMKMRIDAP